jgi:hypothetical protein
MALYILTKVHLGTNCFIYRIIPIPFEALVTVFWIWWFHKRCSSIITTKVFDLWTGLMTDSQSSILGSVTKFEIRYLEPIILYSVLPLLNVSLFASNHWCTFSKSTLMLSCSSSFVFSAIGWNVTMCHRQTCTLAEHEVRQFGRSFIYNKNRSGPTLEPWGIPHLTVLVLDIVWSTLHIWILLEPQTI